MAFIEKQKKGGRTYYYLTNTLRIDNSFKKIRILLSNKNISDTEIKRLSRLKEKELDDKASTFKKQSLFFDPKGVDKDNFRDRFLVWERPCRLYLVHTCADALIKPQIKNFGKGWTKTHGFFDGNMVKFVWNLKHFVKNGTYIINNMIDRGYFSRKMDDYEKLKDKFVEIQKSLDKTDVSKLTNKKFLELFSEYHRRMYDWWGFTQVCELISYSSEHHLMKAIPKNKFATISSPSEKSYTTIEEEDLYKIASKIKRNKKIYNLFLKDANIISKGISKFPDIKRQIEKHTNDYYWKQNNYYDTKVLTKKHFINEIKEIIEHNVNTSQIIKSNDKRLAELKKEKERLLKNASIEERYKLLIKLLDFIATYQDKRKEMNLRAHHYLHIFIKELSKRTGIDQNILYWCTPYEFPDILQGGFNIDELKKRQKNMAMILDEKKMVFLTGKEALKKEEEILGKTDYSGISEFEGMRSQGGKVVGRVVKILDPRKSSHFKKGDILVTTMTSPDFVVLMKKAAAIVTDEGGLTSHAAVVSRELGIPCVIGTKIATDVLSDGDTIEVNANHGLIKIVEKKS